MSAFGLSTHDEPRLLKSIDIRKIYLFSLLIHAFHRRNQRLVRSSSVDGCLFFICNSSLLPTGGLNEILTFYFFLLFLIHVLIIYANAFATFNELSSFPECCLFCQCQFGCHDSQGFILCLYPIILTFTSFSTSFITVSLVLTFPFN